MPAPQQDGYTTGSVLVAFALIAWWAWSLYQHQERNKTPPPDGPILEGNPHVLGYTLGMSFREWFIRSHLLDGASAATMNEGQLLGEYPDVLKPMEDPAFFRAAFDGRGAITSVYAGCDMNCSFEFEAVGDDLMKGQLRRIVACFDRARFQDVKNAMTADFGPAPYDDSRHPLRASWVFHGGLVLVVCAEAGVEAHIELKSV